MKLLVLDGNSILNRAFYGIKLLTTRDGRCTNAIYGFLMIYLALRDQYQPDAVAAAFDVKAPTFRHELYGGYKAQRKGMPPELAEQLPVLKELLEAMGLAVLEAPGWEADDILGTLAAACGGDTQCVLATGDRDSLQLVREGVQVWLAATKMGRPETRKYGPDAVLEEYGVAPPQLIDVKALQGDSSDNIPGVAGVGPKTAQALIARFGTLDALYAALDDPSIKPGLRQKLEQDRENAFLSRKLGAIDCAAPVPVDLAAYLPKAPDSARVTRMMAELEMFKLLERLDLPPAEQQPGAPAKARKLLEEHDLSALLARLKAQQKAYFVPQFNGELLEGLTFAEPEHDSFAASGNLQFFIFCKELLEDGAIAKYTSDTKSLRHFCMQNEIAAQKITFDAALAAYLRSPGASGYDAPRLLREYSCGGFAALCAKLEQELRENGQFALFTEIELPLAQVLARMERAGIAVDAGRIERFGRELDARMQELIEEITAYAGQSFNLNSPKQLGEILFGKLQLRAPKKTKTGWSTNAEVLESLRGEHPIIEGILEYRTVSKLKSTYCDGLLKVVGPDGRIHSTLNQTETRTGRISSSEPNLQNIPVRTELGRELRRCFTARPGWLLADADYSQIELRVMAAMAGEEAMLRAFQAGEDIHTVTASQVFGLPPQLITSALRTRAKAVNFGIIYGIGAFSLAKDIGVSFREAQDYIESYLERYPKVRQFRARLIEQAKERGYAETLYGRRRPLPELSSSQRQLREFGERVAVNMPVQGTAADIIKIAMVRVAGRLSREGFQAQLILQVHDELVAEAPPAEAQA
ncbi:MAG: DNA polymerase I, partial [Firmicutes bacterium]|nr:DNA polymerase I [Bacillota bacterium]